MAKVYKSPEYNEDAYEIWSYIARDNVVAATNLIRTIDKKATMLAQSPGMGRRRDELSIGLRSASIRDYILFYRIVPGGIELVRLMHGARDIPQEFHS